MMTGRFYNIVLYQIALSIIIGALAGYAARKVLRYAEERKSVYRPVLPRLVKVWTTDRLATPLLASPKARPGMIVIYTG